MRVLVIDDDSAFLGMVTAALEEDGHAVVTASDGRHGLLRADDGHPDAIILDLRLPDMDGWAVCRALKADPVMAAIPVIILTAAASPTLKQRAGEHGCAAFLLKPCYPEDLAQTVRQVLAAA